MSTVADAPRMTARDVLDLHADLQRSLARPGPELRRFQRKYWETVATVVAGQNPHAAGGLVHPATSWDDPDPWLASLSTDLFGATTYQVTAEMVDLAEALQETTPDLDEIRDEELPCPWGFMWLDKPVPRPSAADDGRPPLLMHAMSWARVPQAQVLDEKGSERTRELPAIRVREWGYGNDPDLHPHPLHFMGQRTVPVAGRVRTVSKELWALHMLWILMDMEIVTTDPEPADRHGRKRAANLRYQDVRVVRLRRPAHHEQPEGGHRKVDWSCSWLVRGHWRKAPHGGTFSDGRERTWVKPHIKGPDGLPLRASDILYRLAQ